MKFKDIEVGQEYAVAAYRSTDPTMLAAEVQRALVLSKGNGLPSRGYHSKPQKVVEVQFQSKPLTGYFGREIGVMARVLSRNVIGTWEEWAPRVQMENVRRQAKTLARKNDDNVLLFVEDALNEAQIDYTVSGGRFTIRAAELWRLING